MIYPPRLTDEILIGLLNIYSDDERWTPFHRFVIGDRLEDVGDPRAEKVRQHPAGEQQQDVERGIRTCILNLFPEYRRIVVGQLVYMSPDGTYNVFDAREMRPDTVLGIAVQSGTADKIEIMTVGDLRVQADRNSE